jgi:hypothetical protein
MPDAPCSLKVHQLELGGCVLDGEAAPLAMAAAPFRSAARLIVQS